MAYYKHGRNKVRVNDSGSNLPTSANVVATIPSALTTTDSGVRRMQPITWETGASVSNLVNLDHHERISSLLLPSSGWAATATRIYFDVSDDGSTWYPAQDLAGNLIYAQVGASAATKGITLSDEERARISRKYVRCKSTTDAGVAVTQAAAVSCKLGSMNAETANPYNTWSFRVNAAGYGVFEVTQAGRVVWTAYGDTAVTTLNNVLTLTALEKPADISVNAACDFSDAYINIHDGAGIKFKLSHLPAKYNMLKLNNLGSSVISGSLADTPRSLTTLYLSNLGSSVISGSLADTPRSLTYLYFSSLGSSVISGSLADTPRSLTYLQLSYVGSSVISGSLADTPRSLTTLYLYSLGSSVISGNLSTDLPTLITGSLWIYDVGGTISGAAPQSVFGATCKSVKLYNQSFSPTDTDNNIINLSAAVTALSNTNGAAVFETNRTSSSDAAVANLQANGWTVTFA